jgi:hypothetical protein
MGARELGQVRSYEDLVAVLRARCDEFEISFAVLDEVSGLSDGHSSKLLAPGSSLVMGRAALTALLGALGIALIAVEDEAALARVRSRLVKRKRGGPQRQSVERLEAR